MDKTISDFANREEALSSLWARREEFEEKDKLSEFESLEKKIKETPVLNMTLATDLDQSEIAKKAREVFQNDFFVEIRIDPHLIGGCQVIWKGQVYDFSIRKTM